MNEQNTLAYKIYITRFILEKGPQFVVSLIDRWKDIYSERGLLHPIYSSGSLWVPTLAPPWKLVRDASDRPRVPRSIPDSLHLFKSDRVVLITWFCFRYTPVISKCSDVLPYPCSLITAWQRVKALGVTINEPKIHVIYYMTMTLRKGYTLLSPTNYGLSSITAAFLQGWFFDIKYLMNKKTIALITYLGSE